ncbi:His-Xaa-Ser system-associated MauG-like protein [Nitrincola sp.]|uniref:His-Xaa-Ser system-associated MauG-like protein n=1 Tax=Nitrincola sp. TaxID=1926584 RepID=UPI003A9531EE
MLKRLATILLAIPFGAQALTIDEKLSLVAQTFDLSPVSCEIADRHVNRVLAPLGKFIFNTKLMSGDNDTSCATCHLDSIHLADGLPIAIGVGGGDAEGLERMSSEGVVVPRNAFTLFGRANKDLTTFFWDGKVIEQDGLIYSPIGEAASKGFNSGLAVAAVLPLLARDEFLGRMDVFSPSRNLELINSEYFDAQYDAANQLISELLNRDSEEAIELKSIASEVGEPSLTLDVVGNALAAFIAQKVSVECESSDWDRYLRGDLSALTDKQKNGALIFFGKGRCAGCHTGSLMSDQMFHSIGTPQGEFGFHMHGQDIGRAGITYVNEDRYLFRTPPLVGVSKTAPYGHNGVFPSLEDVVMFHLNPIPFLIENGWTSEREMLTYGRLLSARSKMLAYIDIQTHDQVSALTSFLEAL